MVSLIGLGVSIDYSLFITSRFREELQGGQGAEEALATALGGAGRAVAFSGITVAVGLCSLLFFPGTYATSIGLCGALTVLAAVVFALTFLPALLAILGPRIGRVQVRRGKRRGRGGGFWRGLAIRVMRRPIVFLVPTMVLLVLAGMPFLHLRMAAADFHQLPPDDPARLSYNTLSEEFPNQAFTLVSVVVDYPSGNPLSAQRVGDLYDLSRRAATIHGVDRVTGPLESEPGMTRVGYQQLLSKPRDQLPPSVRDTLTGSVGRHIVVMSVISQSDINSTTAQHIAQMLREEHVRGGRVMVTGQTALNMDAVAYILQRAPYAVAFVAGLSLILLFLLTGSVVLPIKAILSNLVSICASFGALVWIFQQGHLQHLLNFTPQPIDPSILVLLFAAVFGLSMDYEVLLVSRIQEKYRETGNNAYAGVTGLQHSGGLITGAA
ncbi:MAG: MMPL family transporter, partial [Candidatus Dormiibacterota bacterium]